MKQIICKCCEDDTTEYLNHTLAENITVCDSCYQELTTLRKIDNQWCEVTRLDGAEYITKNRK